MAFSLPSIPSLPSLPRTLPAAASFVRSPVAVLNAVSLIASNLPKFNPPKPIYAIVNADTFLPLALPDSWGEIMPRFAEYQVADYPIEDGAFAAYNKVRRPVTVDATLVKRGSDLARATWLEAIRQQIQATPLARYNVLTPQGIFPSLTIARGGFQTRQDRGANMLYLELQFTEVLQIETPSLLGGKAVRAESGPMAAIGRVYSQAVDTATARLAAVAAPVNSLLRSFG